MRTNLQLFRFLQRQIMAYSGRHLVVVTGARQTGKTTLARSAWPDLAYINLDAVEQRELLREVRTAEWATSVGPAILDEAQKEPAVFDKVKFAFDAGELSETVLLGSSQILMLQKVRESLAGRAFVFELWPLMAAELAAAPDASPPLPLLDRLLTQTGSADELLGGLPAVIVGSAADRAAAAIAHLAEWGGMPALLPLSDIERGKWLRSYETTYLERDLGDLARLHDLMPFRQFQRLCALRTGQILSYADVSRDAGVAPSTGRRYVEYLQLSYQARLLPPYSANLTSTVVKAPKLYWGDIGLARQLTRYLGPLTGALFETLVITEIHKWVTTFERAASLSFYRTRSGLEVDLLVTTAQGTWGLEMKAAARLRSADWRSLRDVGAALGEQWRGGLVVYRGNTIQRLGENLWAVPVDRLLAAP